MLTFYKMVKEYNYTIEIPIIQRDYVQGRKSAGELRLQFLIVLKDCLEYNKPIELDFIYGSVVKQEGGILFIPLDGQQRLTTLFLLHWYAALKEGRIEEWKAALVDEENEITKFRYETRTTSRDFCEKLIAADDINWELLQQRSIKEVIKDAHWYYRSWDKDPTIHSMLEVLEDIHLLFKGGNDLFTKLTSPDNPVIGFQFIELANFGLTDSLYVKMNSRGKELTDFENFKARFEHYLEQWDLSHGTDFKNRFVNKIDSSWTDLFWQYRNRNTNLFDNELMNFIRVIATNNYSLLQQDKVALEGSVRELRDESRKISFKKLEDLNCLDHTCLTDIITLLTYYEDGGDGIKTYLPNNAIANERLLFEKAISNTLSYTQQVQFFALYKFLIKNQGISSGLEDWMRVIRNLTVNTIYNDAGDFSRSIKGVWLLLPHSSDVLPYLANTANNLEGFMEVQIAEERLKASLMLMSDSWRQTIIDCETHPYFNGQIDFILHFAGLKTAKPDDHKILDIFRQYAAKAFMMFGANGLQSLGSFLWQRALLSKGDYTLRANRNLSFLTDENRDISWKRYLRDDSSKRDLLKQLFDDITVEDTRSHLERVITSSVVTDWRRYFIQRPELLRACGTQKFIRWNSEHDILMLEKSQTNGWHNEYYSYALKVKLEQMGNKVSYQGSNSVDYLKFIDAINGKSLQLSYRLQQGEWYYTFKKSETDTDPLFFSTEEEMIGYLMENKYINQ